MEHSTEAAPQASAPVVLHTTSGGNAAYHNFNNDFAHIQDPNERRRLALAEIDRAPFGWYHVRACVVAGVGAKYHNRPLSNIFSDNCSRFLH